MLEESRRGLALKNRLDGDAEMYEGLLSRESLASSIFEIR